MIIQPTVNRKGQPCYSSLSANYCSPNPRPKTVSQDQTGQDRAVIQLDILDADQSPKLRIQPVPHHLEIEPGRYYFGVEVAGGIWTLPIQLTAYEVEQLLNQAGEAAEGGAE